MEESRRIKMTRRLIKDAYLELLETFPLDKISVSKICELADVNRSTFYKYYVDTSVLLNEIEKDILDQIPKFSKNPDKSLSAQEEAVSQLEQFFIYVKNNVRPFRILMLKLNNMVFARRMIETVIIKNTFETGNKNKLLCNYGYIYAISGVIGILYDWIENDFPMNCKDLAKTALQMSMQANWLDDFEL